MRAITNLLIGFRDSLAFSNRIHLIAQRLFARDLPILCYEWEKKWLLVCDTRVQDHAAAKEVLAQAAYAECIDKSISTAAEPSYINLGANIGAFDIAIAHATNGRARGICVELNPRTFDRLKFNLQINHLDAVYPLNAGAAGRLGQARVASSKCSLADSVYMDSSAEDAQTVRLLPLPDILEEAKFQLPRYSLLKIDCEGAEYEIIAASSAELLQRFDYIVIELHTPPTGQSREDILQRMATAGFKLEWRKTVDSECSLAFWSRIGA